MNNQVSTNPISSEITETLRAIFTGWLITTSRRKKSNTITRYYKRSVVAVNFDEIHEKEIPLYFDKVNPCRNDYADLFQFTNVRLEKAFIKLPVRYQQVLTCYFVYDMKTCEIANHLETNMDVIYNIKSRALQKLRKELTNGKKTTR